MTLLEFLRGRLAEEQAHAEVASRGPWKHEDNLGDRSVVAEDGSPVAAFTYAYPEGPIGLETTDAAHIARWNPARVLAEVDAKRRILELHTPTEVPEHAPADCPTCARWEFDVAMGDDSASPVHYPCPTLRVLALPYSHHPDYREEWAP